MKSCFYTAIYPVAAYTAPPVQTLPVDNDVNNTTVSGNIQIFFHHDMLVRLIISLMVALFSQNLNFLSSFRYLLVIWIQMPQKRS